MTEMIAMGTFSTFWLIALSPPLGGRTPLTPRTLVQIPGAHFGLNDHIVAEVWFQFLAV